MTPIRLARNISKTAGFRDCFPKDHGPPIGNGIMVYQMVTWPMTSRDAESAVTVRQTAVRSAILATVWLLM